MGKKILAAWIFLGILFIVTGYLFTYQEHIRLNLHRIAQTQEIISNIYNMQNNLTDAEAGAQAYVATGDEAHLVLFQEARKEIRDNLEELRRLTVDEAKQKQPLKELQRLLEKRLQLLDRAILSRREQGAQEKEKEELSKEGKKVQAQIRRHLEQMEDLEKSLLDPQWAKNKGKRQTYLLLLSLGTFLSYTSFLVVFYLLNREMQQRKKMERNLTLYQENLRSLASQLSLAEERERRRLALHLHDQIGHTLALTNMAVGKLLERPAATGDDLWQPQLQEVRSLLEQAMRDTQSLIFNISPPILYEFGLAAALEWLTEQFEAKHDIHARFETDRRPCQIEKNLEILLFQAVNELLINVLKHALARHVTVSLWSQNGFLKVGVDDDGKGFSPPADSGWTQDDGFGLFSIRERLQPYNGRLEIKSEPGEGSLITITVPTAPGHGGEH